MAQPEEPILNVFGRLDNDAVGEMAQHDTYEMALNAVKCGNKHKGFGLANEGSTKQVVTLPSNPIGAVYVEARDWYILLFESSEIGYFNTREETYTKIMELNSIRNDDKEPCGTRITKEGTLGCGFNFKGCEWVNIEYNFWNNCNELHVEFSHGCDYYTVNIDEILDPARRKAVVCSDLKTFKCDCIPTMRAIGLEGGGAGLPNGVYRFACRLIDKDGHRTNFFNISNPVSVGSGKNKPGEISGQYVRLHVEGLNCRYGTMELAVIKKVGGTENAFLVEKIHYGTNGVAYEYRGDNGREVAIPIAEITTKKVNYLQGRALKLHDGRMFYYQIKNHKNLNVWRYSNSLSVTLPVYRVPASIAHKYSGLQPLERYLIGLTGQYCDGTETATAPITVQGLESRTGTDPADDDYNENPNTGGTDGETEPGTGSGGGATGGGSGGNGSVTFNNSGNDEYVSYKDAPTDDRILQTDSYYTSGCITGDGACEPDIKEHIEDTRENKDTLEEGENGMDCVECGQEAAQNSYDVIVGTDGGGEGDGETPPCPDTGGRIVVPDIIYIQNSAGNPAFRFIAISQTEYNALAAECEGGGSGADGKSVVEQMDEWAKEAEDRPIWQPKRTEVSVTNGKNTTGGDNTFKGDGTYAEQYDGISIYKVGEVDPKWVASGQLYPFTKNCSGDYIYGTLAGTPVMLMEVPPINYFDSNSVGVQSAKTMGVDETAGYVYMIGLKVSGLPGVLPVDETGKPMCEKQPWKISYIPRDAVNSRVLASGILIHTFAGEANGRDHAVPKHGVNSREYIDRYIEAGGDTFNHEGAAHAENLYTFHSPDTDLGKVPLVCNKFIRTHQLSGDGWRHGLYAESKKDVGFWGRQRDNRGCRESVNLHTASYAYAEANILGITYAKGDSVIDPPPGINLPLLNLNRESSVYLRLDDNIGNHVDQSFIADGLDHAGPVFSAMAAYGHLVRDMQMQYGSLVNARYADIGLYAKGNDRTVEGLVGDAHVGSFNVRRTSYISNRVGDRTFIPSPRHYPDILRRFGFGDPTEPPDSGDRRDPKNRANRYDQMGIVAAAGATGSGSVYYPGTLKCLVFFFCQSRVNTHYRQRGDDEGEVHARNLGKLNLDSSVPIGGHWEDSWLNRFYREIHRESKFLSVLRPALRIFVLLGLPMLVLTGLVELNAIVDIPFKIARLILYFATYLAIIFIVTPHNINRMMGLKDQLKDSQGGADDEDLMQWEDMYCEYNADYNKYSNLAPSIGMSDPYNVCDCDDCSEEHYYRPGGVPTQGINNLIWYSARQYMSTEINAFRDVLMGDYGEMQTNASQIQALKSLNNNLYAITTDGIYQVQYDGNVQNEGLDYLLGNGRALGTPMRYQEGIRQGWSGTVDPNSIEVTPYGMVYIDEKAKAINIFNGQGVETISDNGIYNLTQNFLSFCDSGDGCRDQKIKGAWYSIGYDPRLDRILITKKDGQGGFTLSYDPIEKTWISAHSYIPNVYLWDRATMFSVYDGRVWKHNDSTSKQMIYGKYAPYGVWYHANSLKMTMEHAAAVQFTRVEFHTVADDIKNGTTGRNVTFNKYGANTSYQMTGVYLLDTAYYKCPGHKDIRDQKFVKELYNTTPGLWRNEALRDNTINKDGALVQSDKCDIFRWYTSNASCNLGDGNKSHMADYYLRQMLLLDDPALSGTELKLLRAITYGFKKQK